MTLRRILFIQSTIDNPKTVPHWGYFRAEPAVSWVAAAITEPEWEYQVFDADQAIDDDVVLQQIVSYAPDVIGFSCYTAGFPRALRLAKKIKELNATIFCIFGGWHPSLVPNEVLAEPCVDAVGVGQGERFINVFLRNIESFRGQVMRAESYDPVERSYPSRKAGESLAQFHFPGAPSEEEQRAATIVLTSGGCIFRCTYCCTPAIYGKGSPRRLDLVIAEVRKLVDEHNVNFIFIRDEDPPIFRQFLEQFCDAIINAGMNRLVRFYSFGDTRLMTQSLLEKMATAGWIGLDFGVESFDQEQLRSLRRSPNLLQTGQVFRWTQEVGIFTTANIILWQPGDTKECFSRMGEALRWLQPDEAIPLFFTPFPGTEAAVQCAAHPRRTSRFEDYHLLAPILELDASVTTEELLQMRRAMLDSYYLSPEYTNLIEFRMRQFGDTFWPLTKGRRDRLLRYGIDIWTLNKESESQREYADLPAVPALTQIHGLNT
jgi:magnesium-protoporphyrin IX monomethyl ester (oxidative) cyclase